MKDYRIEEGKWGPLMVVTGLWDDDVLEVMKRDNIRELELNSAKGWKRGDLSFLRQLGFVESFRITDHLIDDISEIHCLHNLRCLAVYTYCKTELDFRCFPQLEECAFEWRPKATSVFDCTTLKHLWIYYYKGKDTEPFSKLTNLEHLEFGNGPASDLGGLSGLQKLRYLEIFLLGKLDSLKGIESLTKLETFRIETCRRLKRIDEVAYLRELRVFDVNNCGDIESLHPLASLPHLARLGFVESTNILDGDLRFLMESKSLEECSFQNRKHYTHTREQIKAAIAARSQAV